ncbi:hypothetical protein KUTeg_008743 [Tegillarca granosa]|uniref:Uncharacterized protein n=1 Tax=Tegillarca granosa TaxID=220873 RepID=A0ABQ9FA09_TEGGR|nr:hypothetical protein KUTeg_008743 [Tegillarca granosa]
MWFNNYAFPTKLNNKIQNMVPKRVENIRYFMQMFFFRDLKDVDMELFKKYERVVGVYQGNIPVSLVSDPDLIQQITVKEFSNFTNRFELIYFGKIMKAGVSNADDNNLKFLRNTISPAFSAGKIKNRTISCTHLKVDQASKGTKAYHCKKPNKMLPLTHRNVNTVIEIIIEISSKGESMEMKGYVDIRLFVSYTMDVKGSTLFGLEIDSLKIQMIHSLIMPRNFSMAILQDRCYFYHVSLLVNIIKLPCFVFIINANYVEWVMFPRINVLLRAFNISFFPKYLCTFFEDVINKTIQMREQDTDVSLTGTEIFGNALTFMVAGYETSANTLPFASYCLATNPDI